MQDRVRPGVPTGGQFGVMAHEEPTTSLSPVDLAGELASLGFDLADSTASFHAIATDPSRPAVQRRAAARAAIERADDDVIHARHCLSDDGTGVAGLAVMFARDDVVLDAALEEYASQEFEDGDEHLFGNDMAAILFESRPGGLARTGVRLQARAEAAGDEDPTYDADDPYGADLMSDDEIASMAGLSPDSDRRAA
jgi:hypothetical protein